jgi:hypothetical protein
MGGSISFRDTGYGVTVHSDGRLEIVAAADLPALDDTETDAESPPSTVLTVFDSRSLYSRTTLTALALGDIYQCDYHG